MHDLTYRSTREDGPRRRRSAASISLALLNGYLLASILTWPFLNRWWIGKLAALAVPQLPKVFFAEWFRVYVVMNLIKWLGFSAGSYSPDHIAARPYALALAYLIPLCILLTILFVRTRLAPSCRRPALVLVCLAIVDYFATLHFANGREL